MRGVREPRQHNCIAHVKIQTKRGTGSIKSIFELLLTESSPKVPLTLILVSPNTDASSAKAETASPPHNTGMQDQRARNL